MTAIGFKNVDQTAFTQLRDPKVDTLRRFRPLVGRKRNQFFVVPLLNCLRAGKVVCSGGLPEKSGPERKNDDIDEYIFGAEKHKIVHTRRADVTDTAGKGFFMFKQVSLSTTSKR